MDSYEVLEHLGLWKWVIFFLVITVVPAVNSVIRDFVRDKREAKLHNIISKLSEMPKILEDLKVIALKRHTENISLAMCESLLQPIMENSAKFLIKVCKDMIEHNNLLAERESIERDIHITIETIWAQNSGWISKFKYKDRRITEAINDKWKAELKQMIFQYFFDCENITPRTIRRLEENIKTEFENIRFNVLSVLQKF